MQAPFCCTHATFASVEACLSAARLARYLPEAKGDRHLALRLYVWNTRLCEAFYLPIQFAEVAARNAIHKPVNARFGAGWYRDTGFRAVLPDRLRQELDKVVADEQRLRRARFTGDHVIAGLSFGFWLNLVTSSYEKHLWTNGMKSSFPNLERGDDREVVYRCLDQLRHFRNKIAHHYAIFDKGPREQLQNAFRVIGWVSTDTHWLADELTNVVRVLSRKPTDRI